MVSSTTLWAAAFVAPQLIAASPLFMSLNKASSDIAKRKFEKDDSLSDDEFEFFQEEYKAAQDIAKKVAGMDDFEDNFYYETFMPQDHKSEDQAEEYQKTFLKKFQDFGDDDDTTVTVTRIKGEEGGCKKDGSRVPYAFVDGLTLTLCDAFFQQPKTADMNCDDKDRTLDEFETPAMTILHEFTHFKPAYFSLDETPSPPFTDKAWGSKAAAELAESDQDAAVVNPDNWMFITLGAYWGDKCGRDIDVSP